MKTLIIAFGLLLMLSSPILMVDFFVDKPILLIMCFILCIIGFKILLNVNKILNFILNFKKEMNY